MTAFKSALGICGLAQTEAAAFLDVSIDTVKSWCAEGPSSPPRDVWLRLADLFDHIQDAADGVADITALDGVDPHAWNNFKADIPADEMPLQGARRAAGAMALLIAISESEIAR